MLGSIQTKASEHKTKQLSYEVLITQGKANAVAWLFESVAAGDELNHNRVPLHCVVQ